MRTRRGLYYPRPDPNPNPNPTQTHFPNKRCRTASNGGGPHQNIINNSKNYYQSCFPNLISPPFPNNINTQNSVNNNLPKMDISGGDNNNHNHNNKNNNKYYNRVPSRKRSRPLNEKIKGPDLFDNLPDDLIITILSKLSSSASSPADLINVLLTCKRMNELGMNSMVLSKASIKSISIKARNWSEYAHKFLKLCCDAGNVEACYLLGMIRFYCLQNRGSGASLMAKAAINSHPHALYSLAVIQFNGSGGTKTDKDLRAGVALCARAAFLGHVDALRELGHCLQDGYGARQNITEGRRFLVQANARELATALSATSSSSNNSYWIPHPPTTARHVSPAVMGGMGSVGCPLLSDFGCNVPPLEGHPANRFLAEWFGCRVGFGFGSGLRMCSHSGCGRPETRRHEFRRCSVCGVVNYCSRACQALDWKLRHKVECAPMERWVDGNGEGNGDER